MLLDTLISNTYSALPILSWAIVGLLVLCTQIITQSSKASLVAALAGLGGSIAYSAVAFETTEMTELFWGTAILDPVGQSFNLIALSSVFLVVLSSVSGVFQKEKKQIRIAYEQFPEFLVCLLFAGFGAAVALTAIDLTSFFLGIETLSIASYCLCGFYRTDERSTESAVKYLLIGAFSTTILLYGLSFIYGATGSTSYAEIFRTIEAGETALVLLGSVFLVAGLGFKLAFVPFHLYTPDVYEGAPTPITGFLSTVVKLAAIGAGLRIFWGFLGASSEYWEAFWLALCVLSIVVGNIGALQQRTVKKLFAFSGIAHAGFLGLALLTANPGAGDLFPLMAYLVVYVAMSLGVFALIGMVEDRDEVFLVEDLKGFGLQKTWQGIALSVYALGMAGIPPLAGFMIKFWVIQALLEQGYVWVSIVAVIASVIGAAYYLRLLVLMFMSTERGRSLEWTSLLDRGYALRIVVFLTLAITVFGGLRPDFYADWILRAIALN